VITNSVDHPQQCADAIQCFFHMRAPPAPGARGSRCKKMLVARISDRGGGFHRFLSPDISFFSRARQLHMRIRTPAADGLILLPNPPLLCSSVHGYSTTKINPSRWISSIKKSTFFFATTDSAVLLVTCFSFLHCWTTRQSPYAVSHSQSHLRLIL
jgi:hypothetical protein